MDIRDRLGRGGPVVLDGGLATTVEAAGHTLDAALWSARMLLDHPDALRDVHLRFARAGAEVLTTASYQLGERSLGAAGGDPASAPTLFARSVVVARQAAELAAAGGRRPLVAGSLGPYGALLADGSEYRGHYGLSAAALRDVHAPRVAALVEAEPDLLACETIPSAAEVEVLATLVADTGLPAWLSVSVGGDGSTTAEGQPLAEALEPAAALSQVVAVGVNCCAWTHVARAVGSLRNLGRPLVAYPNISRRWDAGRGSWRAEATRPGAQDLRAWIDAGVVLVGGCCGTSPDELGRLAQLIPSAEGPPAS